jgi:periplasmic divalent cation tolerance protein
MVGINKKNVNQAMIVYTTCPNQECAQTLTQTLLEKKLCACVNIIPGVQVSYLWNGVIESGHEVGVIIKTLAHVYPKLERELRKLHPYEIPCIIGVQVSQVLEKYHDWLARELK